MAVCDQSSIVSKGVPQTVCNMLGGYSTEATRQSDIRFISIYTGQNSNQIVADTPLVLFLGYQTV